tara:strand:+ start:72 stop:194 length:123 start_codon:yes stop_codon:yes gene_type:complete
MQGCGWQLAGYIVVTHCEFGLINGVSVVPLFIASSAAFAS